MADSYHGIVARYVDTSNWFMIVFAGTESGGGFVTSTLVARKRVSGTITDLQSYTINGGAVTSTFYTIACLIDSAGRWRAFLGGAQVMEGQDSVLATGGTLASGDVGLYSENTSASQGDHRADNLIASAYVSDAAVFASQSLEVRHDGVIREDSGGAIWQPVSEYEGDLLRVPAAGREGRSVRWIAKACRNDPAVGPDSAIDDISARLTQLPLYLTVPSP